MLRDVRRPRSLILAIATAKRLLAAVAALVHSDVRRHSSSILAIVTAERLLTRVSALVTSYERWPVSAILAIATPQPLHTRTVITSASQRVVGTICATRRTQAQSAQPPRNHTHNRKTYGKAHTTVASTLHATRHLPSSSARRHTRGPEFRHQRAAWVTVVCAGLCASRQPQPHAFVSTHASLCISDAAVTSPDTLHSYCFTAATCPLHTEQCRHAVDTPRRHLRDNARTHRHNH